MQVRKNAASLSNDEWSRLMRAFIKLKHTMLGGSSVSIFDQFVAIHRAVTGLSGAQTSDGAHGGPAFLPWHREYLRRLELALQFVEPEVTLPYWNWGSGPASDTTALFQDNRIGPMGTGGASGREIASGYLTLNANALNPMGWSIHASLRPLTQTLQRNQVLNTGAGFPTGTTVANILTQASYNLFRPSLENPHNTVHVRMGGDMLQMTSPNDPIFYLHHCQIDRIWAKWQVDHPGSANYNPLGNGGQGHRLEDAMWPWDNNASQTIWTTIQNLLPDFSMIDIVRPIDVIDHHDLGYCYDDEPGCPCNLTSPGSIGPIGPITTLAIGEEGPPTTLRFGEENPTTLRRGEENPTTLRLGEENPPTTRAIGEEGPGTTFRRGEEGGPITFVENGPGGSIADDDGGPFGDF